MLIFFLSGFSEKLSKVGTQPLIGTQINLRFQNIIGKITLYATSEKGYKNLTKLSSSSYLKKNEMDDPSCEINDLILNNLKNLIIYYFHNQNILSNLKLVLVLFLLEYLIVHQYLIHLVLLLF